MPFFISKVLNVIDRYHVYVHKEVSNAPLIVFRICFGLLLFYSTVRTWQKGWIDEMYIDPVYHFSFFDWVVPAPEEIMYYFFILLALTALFISLGFLYKISTFLHFLIFLYVELLDKTYYLNHYYLVTLLLFWMIWVPANRRFSLDAILFPELRKTKCHNWSILIFKIQLSIVYFFAGLAKVNPDWLFKAEPMATWLPGKYELPVLGSWMHLKETALLFSWAGCLYDLTIWIFLWIKRTRWIAYLAVLVFHVLTGVLFPRIGMFPYIMIVSTIIFFDETVYENLLSTFEKKSEKTRKSVLRKHRAVWMTACMSLYILIQLVLPIRYLWYNGNLFWNENGYRFSWRVMLMEKNGYSELIVRNPKTGKQYEVYQDRYLTPFQKQQMKSQPDMIYQFVHYIGNEFAATKGFAPEIYVDSRMSLNGRRSKVYVDPTVDIYALKTFNTSEWIVPLDQ